MKKLGLNELREEYLSFESKVIYVCPVFAGSDNDPVFY